MGYDETMSITTVNMHVDALKSLLEMAKRHRYIDVNPAEGLSIKQRKKVSKIRSPFDQKDLETIFTSSQYVNDSHKKPYQFWLPVLALYTGCRLEELCQLRVSDIKQVDALWVLDINADHPHKRIKNNDSERLVPLHPILTEDLNFPGYALKQKDGRVFPELKRLKTRYGHYVSRWFGTHIRKLGITDKKKVFHSFRHTLIDTLNGKFNVDWRFIKGITGHSPGGGEAESRYAKDLSPKVLFENAIVKLDYEVDLGHLKESRYVVRYTASIG